MQESDAMDAEATSSPRKHNIQYYLDIFRAYGFKEPVGTNVIGAMEAAIQQGQNDNLPEIAKARNEVIDAAIKCINNYVTHNLGESAHKVATLLKRDLGYELLPDNEERILEARRHEATYHLGYAFNFGDPSLIVKCADKKADLGDPVNPYAYLNMRQQARAFYLDKAYENYDEGNINAARHAIRLAGKYGELTAPVMRLAGLNPTAKYLYKNNGPKPEERVRILLGNFIHQITHGNYRAACILGLTRLAKPAGPKLG